jgi:hypothetical protein
MNTVAISPLTCEQASDARYHLISGGGVKAIHAAMTKVNFLSLLQERRFRNPFMQYDVRGGTGLH